MGQYKKWERPLRLTAAKNLKPGDDGIPFTHFLEANSVIVFSGHEYYLSIGINEREFLPI